LKKHLYILLTVLLFVLSIIDSKGQCDFDYYVTGNAPDTCLIVGNDISFFYNASPVIWRATPVLGGPPIVFQFPASQNAIWANPPSGTFTIDLLNASFNLLCSGTITILPGPLFLSDTTLTYCQGNTINLANIIDSNQRMKQFCHPVMRFNLSCVGVIS